MDGFDLFLTVIIHWLLHHLATQPASSFAFPRTIEQPPQVITVIEYVNTTIRDEIEQHMQTSPDFTGLSLTTFFICMLSLLVLILLVILGASHADTCTLALDSYTDAFFGLSSDDYTFSGKPDFIHISAGTNTTDLVRELAKKSDASTQTVPVSSPIDTNEIAMARPLSPPVLPAPATTRDASTQTVRTVFPIVRASAAAPHPPPPSSAFSFSAPGPATSYAPPAAFDFGKPLRFGGEEAPVAGPSGGYTLSAAQLTEAVSSPYSGTATDAVAENGQEGAEEKKPNKKGKRQRRAAKNRAAAEEAARKEGEGL